MKYQNKLSKLRHLLLAVEGKSLKQVLLRAAAENAEGIAQNVHTTEEIFKTLSNTITTRVGELTSDESFNIVADADKLKEFKKQLIDSIIQKFEWNETKFILLDGLSKKDRVIIEPLLNNQYNDILCSEACGDSYYVTSGFKRILLPIIRRIFENLVIRDLIGVQPMSGPLGLLYMLRYSGVDKNTSTFINKEKDEQSSTETTSPINEKEVIGKKMTLSVLSQVVQAGSRKLQAGWTIEAMQDLNAPHGLDLENELVEALAHEVIEEITSEIMDDLKDLAGEPTVAKLEGTTESQITQLATSIHHASNNIGSKTRRDCGNWVVVPSLIADILKTFYKSNATSSIFVPSPKNDKGYGGLQKVGTLNGTIVVYTSFFDMEPDEVLVGYKGGNGETDAGYFYCPYVPLMSSGVVVNPESFQPVISFMTRHGKFADEQAANYYISIKIESDLLVLKDDEESSNIDANA